MLATTSQPTLRRVLIMLSFTTGGTDYPAFPAAFRVFNSRFGTFQLGFEFALVQRARSMSRNDWEARYQSGDTHWDKGAPSPGLIDFLHEHPEDAKTILEKRPISSGRKP